MKVTKDVVSIGEIQPSERVVTSNEIIIRSNFQPFTQPAIEKMRPEIKGYTFTETRYEIAEYISNLDNQITELQLVIADMYEGVDE